MADKSCEVRMKRGLVYTISDLPEDLVADILSRLPITSLGSIRSTCKLWNVLSTNRIFGKVVEAKNMFVGFMMNHLKICSVRIDLQDGDDFIIDLSIKQVSVLNQILVDRIYHCDGLLLCPLCDTTSLLVWNPYLGQRRWIPHLFGSYDGFSLGYDNSGKHKILQYLGFYDHNSHPAFGFKIYEFSSNSWRNLDVTPNWKLPTYYPQRQSVTLKGNAYFYAQEEIIVEGAIIMEHFLLCFDFTSERFGRRLSLPPFACYFGDSVVLSCVRDEQLAVLYKRWDNREIMEIWITNKIDYNEVLWTKWMQVDIHLNFGRNFFGPFPGSFFIDEGNRAAVVFYKDIIKKLVYPRAHIIGQDKCCRPKKVEAVNPDPYGIAVVSLLCSSSYVPSLVQIE